MWPYRSVVCSHLEDHSLKQAAVLMFRSVSGSGFAFCASDGF